MYQKWIDALRSGKYKQGKNNLRDFNDNYCCLGVLCDIEDNTKWKALIGKGCYLYEYAVGRLPSSIQNKYNITEEEVGTFINMNDSYNNTFEEIADYIEEHYVPKVG